ncbi:hypothetical protein GB937_005160 [Aspergillus fischeri]|nr:hypothetical protein GB937_005160 [Aspergillus fischeri]
MPLFVSGEADTGGTNYKLMKDLNGTAGDALASSRQIIPSTSVPLIPPSSGSNHWRSIGDWPTNHNIGSYVQSLGDSTRAKICHAGVGSHEAVLEVPVAVAELRILDQIRDITTQNHRNLGLIIPSSQTRLPGLRRQNSGIQRSSIGNHFGVAFDDEIYGVAQLMENPALAIEFQAMFILDIQSPTITSTFPATLVDMLFNCIVALRNSSLCKPHWPTPSGQPVNQRDVRL